jgi:capsular exopolysaccharide synthesis family protein
MAFTLRRPKLYRATTVVEIGAEIPDVAFFKEVVSVNPTNWWSIGRYYETQYKIIKSDAILSQVSKQLIEKNIWPAVKGVENSRAYIGRLRGLLSIDPMGESSLVAVVCEDTDNQHIATVCNTVSQIYVEENLNRKLVSARQAVDWLSQQMKSFEDDKTSSEVELQEFKEKYKIVSMENPREIMEGNLKGLTESLNDLTKDRIKLEARYTQLETMVKSSKGTEELFGIVDSDLLKKLKSDYVDQQRKFLVLSVRYKGMHPEIIRARQEVDELRKKIVMEVNNEVQRYKSRYLLTKAEEDRIREELERKKLEALEFDKISYQLKNIVRTADTNQKFFGALSEKLKEADLSGLVKSNNIRIIDPAQPPKYPFSPNVGINFLLSIFVGIIGGVFLAFSWDYMDATFKSQADVQNLFKVPFLGIIPLVNLTKIENGKVRSNGGKKSTIEEPSQIEYVPVNNPNSTVAEMYRNIRTNLSFATSTKNEKIIIITSTSPEEGKTATSLNLSITLAQLGQRVLLIDSDLRRPSIHRVFSVSERKGFSSLLIKAISLEEAIHHTSIERLDIIPAGPIPPNPSELLSSTAVDEVFNSLRNRYDKIIVDACPIIPISDTLILSQKVDGIVFVIRAEGPHRNIVTKAKNQLEAIKANIIGCILNGVAPDRMEMADRHYYQYGYYRYRQGGSVEEPEQPTTNS